MKSKFIGYYRPTEAEFAQLWRDCFFVPDANSILNLYRYSPETSAALMDILERLKDRIWVPYQVAEEFHRNRLIVISQSVEVYDKHANQLKAEVRDLRSLRHPNISPPLLDKLDKTVTEVCDEMQARRNAMAGSFSSDLIRDKLFVLLDGKVGDLIPPEKLAQLCEEAKTRFARKIPPGYKDKDKEKKAKTNGNEKADPEKKEDEPIVANVNQHRRYGDFILWHQLIEEVKKRQKPVIFITDDIKEDWWLIHNSQNGKQLLGPRPELIQEMHDQTGMRFHIYKPDTFMDHAKHYCHFDIKQEAIDEAKAINEEKAAYERRRMEARRKYARDLEIKHGTVTIRTARATAFTLINMLRSRLAAFNVAAQRHDTAKAKQLFQEMATTIRSALDITAFAAYFKIVRLDIVIDRLEAAANLDSEGDKANHYWDYATKVAGDLTYMVDSQFTRHKVTT